MLHVACAEPQGAISATCVYVYPATITYPPTDRHPRPHTNTQTQPPPPQRSPGAAIVNHASAVAVVGGGAAAAAAASGAGRGCAAAATSCDATTSCAAFRAGAGAAAAARRSSSAEARLTQVAKRNYRKVFGFGTKTEISAVKLPRWVLNEPLALAENERLTSSARVRTNALSSARLRAMRHGLKTGRNPWYVHRIERPLDVCSLNMRACRNNNHRCISCHLLRLPVLILPPRALL
jgi:hypothetical protein